MKKRFGRFALPWGAALLALACAVPESRAGEIVNIDAMLQTCPQNDPAFSTIASDFRIRRNGNLVSVPACSEPVSAMPTSQYTDALVLLQGLRVMYYMDRGQSGHLPWTSGSLYDWMKTKIRGFDVVGSATASGGYCCESKPDGLYVVMYPADDFNRDFDRSWRGISGNILFYAHEARHVDGFPHVSCCGISNGCDQTFDSARLSPYAVQWWLEDLMVTGVIDVGVGCLPESEGEEILYWQTLDANYFRDRFCSGPPPLVSPPPISDFACSVPYRGRVSPPGAPATAGVAGRGGI